MRISHKKKLKTYFVQIMRLRISSLVVEEKEIMIKTTYTKKRKEKKKEGRRQKINFK